MQLTHPDFIKDVTSEWEGERDANGRPLVSDDILKRMELVTTEEAWGVCRRNGYNDQFAGDWKILHPEAMLERLELLLGRHLEDVDTRVEELTSLRDEIGRYRHRVGSRIAGMRRRRERSRNGGTAP